MTTLRQCSNAPIVIRPITRTVVQDTSTPRVLHQQDGATAVVDRQTSDVLQVHQGERGLPGPQGAPGPAGGTSFQGTSLTALGGHRVVRGPRGALSYASADDATHADDVQGITLHAVSAGVLVNVQGGDEVVEPSWAWTPFEPVYLGLNGQLTQVIPERPNAAFLLTIGFASGATSLVVRIEPPIYFED